MQFENVKMWKCEKYEKCENVENAKRRRLVGFQIPDIRSHISDSGFPDSRTGISDSRFQIPDVKFQISDFIFQIGGDEKYFLVAKPGR